ncbi:FAD-binding oxidoreductase [Streptomyces sp. NPDC057433]|uniref:FAD-binding oxidoreductase n=1 Tax=Streptomyces sp. NPDC057433 TaxID=3346132 RepID=UPI0036908CFB
MFVLPVHCAELGFVDLAAREAGTTVAVRGGGHNVAGSGSNDGGLVMDLKLMRGVTVDPVRALARVQGGATWDDIDAAAARYGLATTGGTVGSTGVAGLTLGGGLGYLTRSLGLACDRVESYRMVTGDGRRRWIDAEHDAELNRLLRGAGHGLGVVDEFTFRLAPVPRVYGGRFAYPLRYATPVMAAFTELMADTPADMTCLLMLEPWGDPAVRSVVANVFYSGGDEVVVRRIERMMACAPLTGKDFGPRSYLPMQASLGETDFGPRHRRAGGHRRGRHPYRPGRSRHRWPARPRVALRAPSWRSVTPPASSARSSPPYRPGEESARLYDSIAALSAVTAFSELKRARA